MATREAILAALLAKVQGGGYFVTTGRRARDPSSIGPAQSPACFLVVANETFERKAPNLAAIRTLNVSAFIYNDIGAAPNVYPETALNNAMEALEAVLVPDDARTGFCTLGGLVYACYLKGQARRAPAELTGKALAIVPIEVIIP
jgi:hypothetical protein